MAVEAVAVEVVLRAAPAERAVAVELVDGGGGGGGDGAGAHRLLASYMRCCSLSRRPSTSAISAFLPLSVCSCVCMYAPT